MKEPKKTSMDGKGPGQSVASAENPLIRNAQSTISDGAERSPGNIAQAWMASNNPNHMKQAIFQFLRAFFGFIQRSEKD